MFTSCLGIKTGNPFIEHDENPGVYSTGQLMLLQIAYESESIMILFLYAKMKDRDPCEGGAVG